MNQIIWVFIHVHYIMANNELYNIMLYTFFWGPTFLPMKHKPKVAYFDTTWQHSEHCLAYGRSRAAAIGSCYEHTANGTAHWVLLGHQNSLTPYHESGDPWPWWFTFLETGRSVQNSLLSVAAALIWSVCFAFEKVMKTASYNRFGHLMALLDFRMQDGIMG